MSDSSWWKERVFYQIYPRSFKDSNGDGIGDIQGIISRLDYLSWLGIGAVWLCPIYDSPNADMGYDIRDYKKIMEELGTEEDFRQLLEELHKRDIKLVMDLVVNHTSDEHAWFVESRSSCDNPYRDYYIWRNGKGGKEPNNWASFFTQSAWTYDDRTNQWYLHLFSEKQPDLNWDNPKVRFDVYNIINHWLDLGVDGFRMDVISLIAKADGLPSISGDGYVFADKYIAFQPKLHSYLREMRKLCFDGRNCMCVGETTFVNTQNANSVVGDGNELDMLFQFDVMDMDGKDGKWTVLPFDLKKFNTIICNWQKAIDWNTLFWGNHDQPRVVSRFGSIETEALRIQSAKMLAVSMYLLRGTPFIYQGEEIGMTNFPFTDKSQLRDIESINLLNDSKINDREDWAWNGILHKGRDNARTPMQWDETQNAGFTAGKPWIDVNPNYLMINVKDAMSDENSILHFYRKLISLRNSSLALKYGVFESIDIESSGLFAFRRTYGIESFSIYCNFSLAPVPFTKEGLGEVVLESQVSDDAILPFGFLITKKQHWIKCINPLQG